MLCDCVGDVMDVVFSVCIEGCSSPVSTITERRDMGLLCVFVGFWDRTMLTNFHV